MPVLPLLAAVASLHAVDVPSTFGDKVDQVSVKADLPVLLPQTIRTEFKKLYPDGSATKKSYSLELGAAKGCFGATACGVAYFGATKGGTPIGEQTVSLAHGITGRYTPVHCGASCAPPQVQWKENGAVYFVQIKGLAHDKRGNVRAANSAIRAGGRYND